MFEKISRFILPSGIVLLLILNTISTCSSEKFQQDVDYSLKSIEKGQDKIKSAVDNIDSANTSIRVSIDTLTVLEDRLRKTQDQLLKLREAYKKSMIEGDAAAKEIENQIKADRHKLGRYKWQNQ